MGELSDCKYGYVCKFHEKECKELEGNGDLEYTSCWRARELDNILSEEFKEGLIKHLNMEKKYYEDKQ